MWNMHNENRAMLIIFGLLVQSIFFNWTPGTPLSVSENKYASNKKSRVNCLQWREKKNDEEIACKNMNWYINRQTPEHA